MAEEIARHSDLYYNAAAPEISDAAFDAVGRIEAIGARHPQLQRVGAEIEPLGRVDHRFPMRSLDKGTEDADLVHFVQQTAGGATRILAQPKLDGSALSLNTAAGASCGCHARKYDRKMTWNAQKVANVPDRLSAPVDAHVRGEVVMPLEVFEAKYREVFPT